MKKLTIFLIFSTFLFGILLGVAIIIPIANKVITFLQAGDKDESTFHYSQSIQEYENAQRLWPLLQYNQTFIGKLQSERQILKDLQSQPAVTIFLKPSATQSEISALTNTLRSISGVTQIKYISQEDALEIYKKQHAKDPLLLDLVTAKILPASIQVFVSTQFNKTKDQITNLSRSKPFVENVIKAYDY